MDRKQSKKERWYMVKWKGWGEEYNEWVPEKDMENGPELRRRYEVKHSGTSKKQKTK